MKEDIKCMAFLELYKLYQFVCSCPINNNDVAKRTIKNRIVEIEEELYIRAFGFNPYKPLPKVVAHVEGQDPVDVLNQINEEVE